MRERAGGMTEIMFSNWFGSPPSLSVRCSSSASVCQPCHNRFYSEVMCLSSPSHPSHASFKSTVRLPTTRAGLTFSLWPCAILLLAVPPATPCDFRPYGQTTADVDRDINMRLWDDNRVTTVGVSLPTLECIFDFHTKCSQVIINHYNCNYQSI